MSTTDNDTSDVKKAAEQVNGEEVEKNLNDSQLEGNKATNKPESLSDDEQTPFIEDDLRTDK